MLKLFYAPDNASLIIRVALLELGVPFQAKLVDRRAKQQKSSEFLKLNPLGKIPVLQEDENTLFETAAILLWLSQRYPGLAPGVSSVEYSSFLSRLMMISNTLHADCCTLFYQERYLPEEAGPHTPARAQFSRALQHRILNALKIFETEAIEQEWASPYGFTCLDIYLSILIRWLHLYPTHDAGWLNANAMLPKLMGRSERIERRSSFREAAEDEGLGPFPLSKPEYPEPPEGFAL